MDFLKKNWPLLLIVVIAAILYFLFFKKASLTSNEKGLATNDDKYNPFNLGVSFNIDKDAVTYTAQGNGNTVEGTWTLARSEQTMPQNYSGSTIEEIINYEKSSSDNDFYFCIRSVRMYAGVERYDVFAVYDAKVNVPDPFNPNEAKAVIKVDWNTKQITVVKSSSDKQV